MSSSYICSTVTSLVVNANAVDCLDWYTRHPSTSVASSDYWWWTGVKDGTFGRGAPCVNPSARTQLFAADRRTSHGSKKEETPGARRKRQRKQENRMLPHRPTEDRELEAPTMANRALGLMLILEVAVAQKDRCHLVGHLRMPRARWNVLSRNRKKHHITVRDLLRFLTSSRRFS